MAAGIPRPSVIENVSTSLSAGITDIATTISVNDASSLVAPCYVMIDRVDSAGTEKSTALWELVKVTSINSNDLTVTRGQNGTTNQSHSSGAILEAVVSSAMFEEWYSVLNPEHDAAGGHVIVGTMTVAGMNLASVATIASLGAGNVNVATSLALSTASVTGFARTFVWYMPGTASAATTNVMRITAPFSGTFRAFTATTRTPVSGASLTLAAYVIGSGASIFDTIGRPAILGGGTFVSTASIKAANFTAGQTIRADIETGGSVSDIILEGISY